jgi:hypothetical protein
MSGYQKPSQSRRALRFRHFEPMEWGKIAQFKTRFSKKQPKKAKSLTENR